MYYNFGNARQTFHLPAGLQMAIGYITLHHRPPVAQALENKPLAPNEALGLANTQDVNSWMQLQYDKTFQPNIASTSGESPWPSDAYVVTHRLRDEKENLGLRSLP